MPYIKQAARLKFDEHLDFLPAFETKGDLEYCIYKLMQKYAAARDRNYSNLHDCTYAAIHCGDEFRRRNLDAREDFAKDTNGDITV
jgi:hypothetical protein